MGIVTISDRIGIPKYKQIVSSIEDAVLKGVLKKGDKLPSLNSIKNQHSLSRDTVLTAFNELKTRGIIQSVVGKGYYVLSEDIAISQKIFLLFDEFNSFKEDLYNSFLESFGENVQIEIFFHHFNRDVFSKLINDNAGEYSCYIIMPANLSNVAQFLERLPSDKVYILDQTSSDLFKYPSVHQNFEKDIYNGLLNGETLIRNYNKIVLAFSPEKQPSGILSGFKLFCNSHDITFEIVSSVQNIEPKKGELYVVLEDKSLIRIIKKIKEKQFVLGEEVGIISYNDTLLKEIVEGGITTISTDFNYMGGRLAKMIMSDEKAQIDNPSSLIIRKSL